MNYTYVIRKFIQEIFLLKNLSLSHYFTSYNNTSISTTMLTCTCKVEFFSGLPVVCNTIYKATQRNKIKFQTTNFMHFNLCIY